MFGKTHLLRI